MYSAHRKLRSERFVQVPSSTIRDSRLSWKARGLLAYLLDHPEGWQVRADDLAKAGPDGVASIRSGLIELREAGYYRVERRRMRSGSFQMGTAVAEVAQEEWAAQAREFGGQPIPMRERKGGGGFIVVHRDGTLTSDGFPQEEVAPSPLSGPGDVDSDGLLSPGAGFPPPVESHSPGAGFPTPVNPPPFTEGNYQKVNTPGGPVDDVTASRVSGGESRDAAGDEHEGGAELRLLTDEALGQPEGPQARRTAPGDPAFEEFWKAYPRKVGKGQARKAWTAAVKKAPAPEIVTALQQAVEQWQRAGTEQRFIPHASSWLNAERWTDEVAAEQAAPSAWETAMSPSEYARSIGIG